MTLADLQNGLKKNTGREYEINEAQVQGTTYKINVQ